MEAMLSYAKQMANNKEILKKINRMFELDEKSDSVYQKIIPKDQYEKLKKATELIYGKDASVDEHAGINNCKPSSTEEKKAIDFCNEIWGKYRPLGIEIMHNYRAKRRILETAIFDTIHTTPFPAADGPDLYQAASSLPKEEILLLTILSSDSMKNKTHQESGNFMGAFLRARNEVSDVFGSSDLLYKTLKENMKRS